MVITRSMARAAAAPAAALADIRAPDRPPNLATGPPEYQFEDIRDLADMIRSMGDQERRDMSAEAARIRQSLNGAQS